MNLQQLSKSIHPYYCSTTNYFSNEASEHYSTMQDFVEMYHDADIDMNLIFRWDIEEVLDEDTDEPTGKYRAEVFLMKQRKGIFSPCVIDSVTDEELPGFLEIAKKHWAYLTDLWMPISEASEK